jgi:hypothetical protein
MGTQFHDAASTDFRSVIAKICILLSFSVLASKLTQLLITTETERTNRIQREFLFNNGIQSQKFLSASKHPRQKTNLYKQRCAVTPLSIVSLRTLWGGVGGGDCATHLCSFFPLR